MSGREIGGYFGLDEYTGRDYYENLYHLNLGRTAIACLIEALKCRRIYLPYFLCDSVISAVKKTGCEIRFYHVSDSFEPQLDEEISDGDYVFVVNYYGQLSDTYLLELQKKHKRIILDNTHAFYQRPIKEIPTVYSVRKFFGLPEGAILSYNGILPKMKRDVSAGRMGHILGRYEDGASAHYSEMLETAGGFYDEEPKEMSLLTRNLMRAIDYDAAKKRRNQNFKLLSEFLGKYNGKKFDFPDGAFCYPFYAKDGIAIRSKLAQKNIFVPTYWKNVMEECAKDSVEYDMAANILALPCDQRYGEDDMVRIADEVKRLI